MEKIKKEEVDIGQIFQGCAKKMEWKRKRIYPVLANMSELTRDPLATGQFRKVSYDRHGIEAEAAADADPKNVGMYKKMIQAGKEAGYTIDKRLDAMLENCPRQKFVPMKVMLLFLLVFKSDCLFSVVSLYMCRHLTLTRARHIFMRRT